MEQEHFKGAGIRAFDILCLINKFNNKDFTILTSAHWSRCGNYLDQ